MHWTIPDDYREFGVKHGAKVEDSTARYEDLAFILEAIKSLPKEEICPWLEAHKGELMPRTVVLYAMGPKDIKRANIPENCHLIFNKRSISHVRHLNSLLNECNYALDEGGYLWCHSRTSSLKYQIITHSHPGITGKILYGFHYVWHRVMAKSRLTRWFYMMVTSGKNRSYSRVEILGRFCRAGFDIIDERFSHGEFFVLGRKMREPRPGKAKNYGFTVKLNRIGYKGKRIGVYKIRTMYPYSEYLQPYMMEHEGLEEGGKFANDYRVNWWGKKFRSTWIDEIPMVLNILKGEMKLVGVRPLSSQYLKLYSPEMQELHISVKPGLLPPYYYEDTKPSDVEAVQESERRYIEAYKAHPARTQWRYFWGIMKNIVLKHKRSH